MKLYFKQKTILAKLLFFCLIGLIASQMWFYDILSEDKKKIIAVDKLAQSYLRGLPSHIKFPENMVDLETGKMIKLDTVSTKHFKIINFINPGCFKCIEILPGWQNFIDSYYENNSLEFLFIATGPSRNYLNYMIKRRMKFKYPVLYDSQNVMHILNDSLQIPSTIMLNNNNDVLLAGSPILHSDLKQLYIEKIKSLNYDDKRKQ